MFWTSGQAASGTTLGRCFRHAHPGGDAGVDQGTL